MPNVFVHPRVRTEPWRPGPLGSLWLLELLGRSDRSAAWLVAENKTEARYVLCTPAAPFWPGAAIARWATTVAATAAVKHPSLARSVRAGHHAGRPYLLYDLADWRPLGDHLHRAAVLPGDALKLAADAAGALAALHAAGQLHGDLEPWTLLVSPDGRRCVLVGAGVASVESVGTIGAADAGAAGDAPREPAFAAEVALLSAMLVDAFAAVPTPASLGPHAPQHPLSQLVWPGDAEPPASGSGSNPARALEARLLHLRDRVGADGRVFLEALAGRIAECGAVPVLLDPDDHEGIVPRLLYARLGDAAAIVAEDVALSIAVMSVADESLTASGRELDPRAVPSLPDAIALIGIDRVLATARALRAEAAVPADMPRADGSELLAALRRRAGGAACAAVHLRLPGSPEHLARMAATLQAFGRQVVAFHAPRAALLIDRRTAELLDAQPPDRLSPGVAQRSAAMAVIGLDLDRVTSVALKLVGARPGLLQLALRWSSDEPARWRGAMQVMSLCGSLANDLADLCQMRPDATRLEDEHVDALAWKYMALLDEHPVPAQDLIQEAFVLCREAQSREPWDAR